MSGKKSSRGPYTPVSESKKKDSGKSSFEPNEELPKDASDMEKAKAQAKRDDAMKNSKLLQALEKEKEEKGAN
tara:strand:- start:4635 stop:4853 length:219 start_codon:yes stop_codon:yes gene_type:complete